MFFKKKNKKEKESLPNPEEQVEEQVEENVKPQDEDVNEDEDLDNLEEIDESELTPKQREKLNNLKSLKSKISRILQSNNIEIVDENAGDDYELDDDKVASEKQKQQDYDSLKAIFGKGGKDKGSEVTLTIDDFDYTYVGKYVDEYDLIHMKNIKRVKLHSKYKKLITKIAIGVTALIVLIVGGVVAYNMTKEKPVYLKAVSLSQTSQTYFRDETFDYTGIYIIAEYSDGVINRIKLSSEHLYDTRGYIEGYGGTIKFTGGNVATLYFTYGGFYNIEFFVNVLEKDESGLTVKYTDGIFDLKAGDYINRDYLITLIDYSNYNSQRLELANSDLDIVIDGQILNYNKENNAFVVASDVTSDSVIEVKYKTYTVTLEKGVYSLSDSKNA